jgi:O-antigen ligase
MKSRVNQGQNRTLGLDVSLSNKILISSLFLVTLIVTPDLTFDPINLPKFTIMVLLAGFLVPRLSDFKKDLLKLKGQPWKLVLLIFLLGQIVSLVGSGAPLSIQLYGAPGRLTGAITYAALSIYFAFCATSENRSTTAKILKYLVTLGLVLSIYGLLQSFGLEFLPYGSSYGSSVFGTLGNSNFLSGFLGISASATVIMAFGAEMTLLRRTLFATYSSMSLVTIYLSNSQQGFFNFVAGLSVGAVIYLFIRRKILLANLTLGIIGFSGLIAVAGIFSKGPLASLIYQTSISTRQGYWSAATSMFANHPFFGIGMDNFLNWYRRSRTLETTIKNPAAVSDSAHNVFLDIGTGSGFITLLAYVGLVCLVIRAIIKVIRRSNSVDINFIALSSAWIAYQVQSLISINQIALATWGWVLSGLLVGYEVRTGRELKFQEKSKIHQQTNIDAGNHVDKGTLIKVFITFLIVVLPFVSSVRFLSTLKTGNPVAIQNSAYLFPHDYSRFLYVATALRDNKFEKEALEVIKDAAEEFPDTFEVWKLYSNLPNASSVEIALAKAEMKRLDPLNPELK